MYPHERSLVKKYQGRPFVLLGVNSDANREEIREVAQRQQLAWRSWWDGQGGPIAAAWKVRGWPTIYLIDHNGTIRVQNVRGEQLEAAIERLVKEAEKARPAS